jgi:DNA-binding response OmpR family regulator
MDYMMGQNPSEEKHLTFGEITINTMTRQVDHKGASLPLSPTEFEMLTYLVKNSDRAISRDELLENVWRFEEPIDTRATDDVVKRLRKKLAPTNVRVGAVWGFGFKLELADDEKTK